MTVMMQDGTYTARDIKFTEGVSNAAKLMDHNEKSMQPYLGDLSAPAQWLFTRVQSINGCDLQNRKTRDV